MQFILRDRTRKFNCLEFIKVLPEAPLMGVRITEYKKNRTLAQNNTFHWWVDIIANDIGETPEYIKEELKAACFGVTQRVVQPRDGLGRFSGQKMILRELKSSASLDTKDFSMLMAATEVLARQLNIILPYPDDYLDTMR